MTVPDGAAGAGVGVLRELVADALRNLYMVRQRSLLALLGIVIGTAAVIAMINIGENAKHQSLRQFLAMGTDILAIRKDFAESGRQPALAVGDAAALRDLREIDAVAPMALVGVEIAHGRDRTVASVAGVTAELFAVARLKPAFGRLLSDFDGGQPFVVLGSGLSRQLSGGGHTAIGDSVRMGGYNHVVVGVLAEVVPNPLFPVDLNGAAFVPLAGMRRVAPAAEVTNIVARMKPGIDDTAAQRAIGGYFAAAPRPRPVVVQSARQLIAAMAEQMQVYTLLLSAIGGISLVVGGVGVMNVMLMSVVERRREIGVRLALGARPRDIRAMFLVEALVLSLAGGTLGMALGIAAAILYARTAGWGFVLSAAALPLGVVTSVAVGLFFGLYPAVRASRLDPIVALRAD